MHEVTIWRETSFQTERDLYLPWSLGQAQPYRIKTYPKRGPRQGKKKYPFPRFFVRTW